MLFIVGNNENNVNNEILVYYPDKQVHLLVWIINYTRYMVHTLK